mmetsp:Transcript_68962/g.121952  ORF Transcript_68962/g.121952 Transcript_68962/m.121952 type:complete len:199 (+) Transcript_68962:55-651(+)
MLTGLVLICFLTPATCDPTGIRCFLQLRKTGSTCESEGLLPVSNVRECQEAVDSLNCVEPGYEFIDRPGGLVSEVKYDFVPAGCSTRCSAEPEHPHYYCGNFNLQPNLSLAVDAAKRVYVYCRSKACCSCSNGWASLEDCPGESCRACRRGFYLFLGTCWTSLTVKIGKYLLVVITAFLFANKYLKYLGYRPSTSKNS